MLDHARVLQPGEVGEPDAVGIEGTQLVRQAQHRSRFAHAPDAGDGYQTGLAEMPFEVGEEAGPADEAGELRR
ncbi:hypothetical protein GCM10022419_015360 [Nonomuraea rosea]|uniref:Uncharacterized protein n=1 Tax=Nonomuraea rosea TaxID=638574 RepID=A0ABP6VNG1_9ACTN